MCIQFIRQLKIRFFQFLLFGAAVIPGGKCAGLADQAQLCIQIPVFLGHKVPDLLLNGIVEDLVSIMANERLGDISRKADAPFLGASLGFADVSNDVHALMADVSSKDGEAIPAFTALVTEMERIKRYGFTPDEYERAKTNLLKPGESQTLTIPYELKDIASFDEDQSAFVLEKDEYGLSLNDTPCGVITIAEDRIIEPVKSIGDSKHSAFEETFSPKVQALLQKLSDTDKIKLVVGGGYSIRCYNNVMGAAGRTCTKLLKKGIPNIVLADGPAGLNVNQSTTVMRDGTPRYPDGLPADWKWGWGSPRGNKNLVE